MVKNQNTTKNSESQGTCRKIFRRRVSPARQSPISTTRADAVLAKAPASKKNKISSSFVADDHTGTASVTKRTATRRDAEDTVDSSSSSSSFPNKGIRVSTARRNPRVMIGSNRAKSENVEALALPLGMSIAAVLSQVLERKDAAGEKISVDHLSEICALAVRESLTNVFGDQFESFVSNFEKSFRSTLMTLRLISESSSMNHGVQQNHYASRTSISEVSAPLSSERNDDTCLEAIGQQLSFNRSVSSTFGRWVVEQARSHDLKTFEIGLTMRKLQLKERELALSSDANLLERIKLSFGFSKTSENQVEDSRHAEPCVDCLVAGLFIMLACLGYATYVFFF